MTELSPVQKYYEDYWAEPDKTSATNDPSRGVRLRLLMSDLRKHRPAKIVDAGCGTGWTVTKLKRLHYDVAGMDISAAALAEARRLDPTGTYEQAVLDGDSWPFGDGTIDFVYSFEVVEHLMAVRHFVREARRCLSQHGHLAITTPYHGIAKNIAISLLDFDKHFAVDGQHVRFFTLRSLTSLLREEGFTPVRSAFYGRVRPLSEGMYVLAQRA